MRTAAGTSATNVERNQHYSIIAITDGSGAISERYAHGAYRTPTILAPSLSPLASCAVGNRYT